LFAENATVLRNVFSSQEILWMDLRVQISLPYIKGAKNVNKSTFKASNEGGF